MNLSSAYFYLESVLKASQIISSAIDSDKLLSNIMKIIIETAGATNGAIIIDNRVEAQYKDHVIDTNCSIPLAEWEDGCRTIVDMVAQNKSNVVIGCAYEDRSVRTDQYVIKNQPKSILCMPVVHQNELKAVLYVENNLTTDCFKDDQVNVLSVLTSQVAISLENMTVFNSRMKAMEELAEVQRRRAQEEENYRKKQEEFIDRICHEIRNPIQGIVGNCDVIGTALAQIEGSIPQNITNQLETIRLCKDSIEVCSRYQKVITDDVLTLSKLEFNKVKLVVEPFSISKLINNIKCMFEGEANKKELYINYEVIGPAANGIVVGDANRISQILTNLVSNALKFTLKGGVIISSQCDFDPENPSRVIMQTSVHDTGIGVDPSESNFIFDRFSQATQRAVTDYSGSGLGLFISKMLTELMCGKIWVENNKSGGSTFIFTIKLEKAEAEQINTYKRQSSLTDLQAKMEIEKKQMQSRRKLKVLVVEDNRINQRVLTHMLDSCNCICEVANNGLEGFNKFLNTKFDIIFMDVAMPIMDGYECTRKIRQVEKERGGVPITIIGLSGNVRPEYHETGFEVGMSHYLNKPIQKDDIMSLMSQHSLFKTI
jgi:signal transduction histidine kinase/ActR/RegA family two-component response regulator